MAEKENLIDEILPIEWEMFHNVNGEDRASCQDNLIGFRGLRTAQYIEWSDEALASYLEDIKECAAQGRNIAREKYIRMMRVSDPKGYEVLKKELPAVSEEKEAMVEEIWKIALPQTEKMRAEFPLVATGGRPLTIKEERGYPSVENYQKSELLTYSDKTVRLLLEHIRKLEAEGIEFFRRVQENSIRCMGFASMEEAEKQLSKRG